MTCKVIRTCKGLLVLTLLAISARASDSSQLSGSYEVTHKSELGAQTRVELRIHFTNRGSRGLSIERLILRDFPSVREGASQPCSIVLPPHDSTVVTQAFTVRRSEYELWAHGSKPRLVLKLKTPGAPETTKVLRLDRFSHRKAD